MSASTFQVLHVNTTSIPGLTNGLFDEREKDSYGGDDGAAQLTTACVKRTAPIAQFTTLAARTLAALLGTGDLVPFLALDGVNGINLAGVLNGATPGPASGTVHPRRQFLNGLLLLDKLSWRSNGWLEAGATAYAKSAAGATDPIVRTLVTAPTVPLNTERMDLFAATIGGAAIVSPQSIEIEIQHQVENNDEGHDCYDGGLPFPVALKQPGAGGVSQVKVSIDTLDTTTVYTNGVFVGNWRVANHLGVGLSALGLLATVNSPMVRTRNITGPGGAAARRIEIIGTYDGTNNALTLATY